MEQKKKEEKKSNRLIIDKKTKNGREGDRMNVIKKENIGITHLTHYAHIIARKIHNFQFIYQ